MGDATDKLSAAFLPGVWGSLRPLELARDAPAIFALTHGDEMAATWQEMKVGPFPSEEAFAVHVAELAADPLRAFFAIADADGNALGWLCLMEASDAHKTVELGYVLFSPKMQRTRLATEAFYLIMSHAFGSLGYQRLEWTCTATNMRSCRAADRLGFRFEGTMRSKLILKSTTRDIAMYALLATEWPERRRAMEAWLDPANFDDGVQRFPLAMRQG